MTYNLWVHRHLLEIFLLYWTLLDLRNKLEYTIITHVRIFYMENKSESQKHVKIILFKSLVK